MTAKTTSSGRNQPVWQFWGGPSCGASGLPSAIEGVSPARVLETSSEALGGITKPVDCCQEAGVLPSNQGRRGPVGSVVGDRPKPCGSTWSCSRDPAPNRGVPLSVSCETFVRACLFGRRGSPHAPPAICARSRLWRGLALAFRLVRAVCLKRFT